MSLIIKIVQPSSPLSEDIVAQVKSEISSIVMLGADIVLVDLKNITSINSPKFLELVRTLREAQSSVGQLFICSVTDQLRMLFELTGLDQVFHILADPNQVHEHLPSLPAKVEAIKSAKSSRNSLKLAG